jgi:hypothetical protein
MLKKASKAIEFLATVLAGVVNSIACGVMIFILHMLSPDYYLKIGVTVILVVFICFIPVMLSFYFLYRNIPLILQCVIAGVIVSAEMWLLESLSYGGRPDHYFIAKLFVVVLGG